MFIFFKLIRNKSNALQHNLKDIMATKYTGTFVFVNATGSTITDASITHTCNKSVDTLTASSLAPGEASQTKILNTESGSKDYWTVTFKIGDKINSRTRKRCNLPNANGKTCVIIFYADDFSVVTPDDGPCMNNNY